MCMVAGKVMMDRNAPAALCDTPQAAYDETKAVIAAWHGRGRNHVAITPRFAITSSPGADGGGRPLAREHPEPPHPVAPFGEPGRDRVDARSSTRRRSTTPTSMPATACSGREPLRPLHPPVGPRGRRACDERLGGGLLPDLEPVPRQRPVRLCAASPRGRARCRIADRHRCRRRHELLDAQDPRRGLQGAAAAGPAARPADELLPHHARQCPGAVAGGADRHARRRHGRRPRRPRRQRHAGDAAEDGDRLEPDGRAVPPADPRRRPGDRRDLCRGPAGRRAAWSSVAAGEPAA